MNDNIKTAREMKDKIKTAREMTMISWSAYFVIAHLLCCAWHAPGIPDFVDTGLHWIGGFSGQDHESHEEPADGTEPLALVQTDVERALSKRLSLNCLPS